MSLKIEKDENVKWSELSILDLLYWFDATNDAKSKKQSVDEYREFLENKGLEARYHGC